MEKYQKYATPRGLIVEIYLQNISLDLNGGEAEETKLELNWQAEDEMQLEDVLQVEYFQEENRLKIVGKQAKLKNARLTLQLPPECEVVADNENGSVSMEQLAGRHIIRTENGSINANNLDGNVELKSENGSISLQNSQGKFKLKSENGSLRAKAISGELKLSNENGASKVVQCSGKLRVKSENGVIRVLRAAFKKATVFSENSPVYYEFASIEQGKFKFKNENGKIQLLLPEDLPYDIEAVTKRGKLHIGLKGEYDGESKPNSKNVELTQGAATVEIQVQNKQGSISILPNSEGFKMSGKVDLSFVVDALDKVVEKIPEEHRKKAQQEFNKAKEKLANLDFGKISNNVEKTLNEVEDELDKFSQKVSDPKFQEDLKQKVRQSVKRVKSNLTSRSREEVDERSRLKILQLLDEEKITPDEAERLLEAIGKQNE
jgi:hypothetical protein